MQEALPAFVLNSEGTPHTAMNETLCKTEKKGQASPLSDEQLMAAFLKGSDAAFGELFSRYKQPLFGFFRRRVADSAHAEELTQETFLAILRGASRYEARALFRTYLYAIGFKILRAHRRRAAFRVAFLGNVPDYREPAVQDGAEVGLLIQQAVAKLAAIDREVLLLREFEELS